MMSAGMPNTMNSTNAASRRNRGTGRLRAGVLGGTGVAPVPPVS